MRNDNTSFRGLLGDVIDQVTLLVRQEMRLAQAEATDKLQEAQHRLIAIIAGLLLGFCGLLILLQAVVAALATSMPVWLASVLVAGVLAILAVVLVKHGQSHLTAEELKPNHSLRSLKKDKEMLAEKVS